MAEAEEDFYSILSEDERASVGGLFINSYIAEFFWHVIKKGNGRVGELVREFFYLEEDGVRAYLHLLYDKNLIYTNWDYRESGHKYEVYKLTEFGERVRKFIKLVGEESVTHPSTRTLSNEIYYLSGVQAWLNPTGASMMLALRASGNKIPYTEFKKLGAGRSFDERAWLKYYDIVDFGYEGATQMVYLTQRGADIMDAIYGKVLERFKQKMKL